MKISKVSLLAILAVGGLTTFGAIAQDASTPTNTPPPPPPGQGGAPKPGKLDEKLGLTGDTKTQFDAIIKDQQDQMKALRADDSLSPDDKKAKSKEIRSATNDKIKALLTPEQYTQFQELTKRHGKGPQAGGSSTNAPSATPPPAPQQ
jgi:Spy/CpxP family protein refolding chaperone